MAVMVAAGAGLVHVTGGTKLAYLHVLYVPILLSGFWFGSAGALVVALVCGVVALGPLMPLDVATQTPQTTLSWVVRSVYFAAIGLLGGFLCALVDAQAREIRRMAFREAITGLPNAAALPDHIATVLERQRTRLVAYMAIEASELHKVTSVLGVEQRDHLLRHVAERIAAQLPADGRLFHLQTQTFGIVMPDFDVAATASLARRLIADLTSPFPLNGIPFVLKAAIGAAVYPTHAHDITSLRRASTSAVAAALAADRPFVVFDPDQDAQQRRRFLLLAGLRDAVRHGGFELYYQPKIDLRTNRCCGVEALLRWHHPTEGMISPAEFIPLVEQTDLIQGVTEWVLDAALAQLVAWRHSHPDLQIACNLSVRNIEDDELVPGLRRLIERHGLAAEERGRLELEVTESGVMTDPARALEVLRALKGIGLRLSIDDFGTGHSSLSYLAALPIDLVKIDQSFALGLESSPANAMIVQAVTDMAHDLGYATAIEGVETEEVLTRVRGFGVDSAQGYYFARPMPVDALEAWLARSSWGRGNEEVPARVGRG